MEQTHHHEVRRIVDADEVQVFVNGEMEFHHTGEDDGIEVELHDNTPE